MLKRKEIINMGTKYMANCASYPYKGYHEFMIQSNYFLPFLIKVIYASLKYQIIDMQYRNC